MPDRSNNNTAENEVTRTAVANDRTASESKSGGEQDSASKNEEFKQVVLQLIDQAERLGQTMPEKEKEEIECSFCGSLVPIWEGIVVSQVCGLPAHLECPVEPLQRALRRVAPDHRFDYASLSKAVDKRMDDDNVDSVSGEISS